MLPYPSGDLHIGHWYAMTPSDARARYLRMNGYNVMFPIGFDAFGLPAENAAIKRGIHPKTWTYSNIDNMRKQLRSMGAMFDWEREAVSADPEYYKWTEWFFAQFFKHGLAYKKMSPVDWCPNCNTTLAREQVWGDDRHCERCGTPVIKKNLDQWYFRITKYADELLNFAGIDWPERVKTLQTNWIGKSEGAHVVFHSEQRRPDRGVHHPTGYAVGRDVHGAGAGTSAGGEADHARSQDRGGRVRQRSDAPHRDRARSDREGQDRRVHRRVCGQSGERRAHPDLDRGLRADDVRHGRDHGRARARRARLPICAEVRPADPAGDRSHRRVDQVVRVGRHHVDRVCRRPALGRHPLRGKSRIAVHHDSAGEDRSNTSRLRAITCSPTAWNEIVGTRWLFIFHDGIEEWNSLEAEQKILARCQELEPDVRDKRSIMEMLWAVEFYRDALYHAEYGAMIHSGAFTGTPGATAKKDVIAWLEQQGIGKGAVTYRIRDWLISRQRYWGSPIPIVYCPEHGQVAVPDDQLPVLLPDDVEWKPTGESPLKLHPTWKHTTCPICGKPAERDTDTMDTFMCSSWYHLRYLSPKYDQGPFDPEEYDYWMPVDATRAASNTRRCI